MYKANFAKKAFLSAILLLNFFLPFSAFSMFQNDSDNQSIYKGYITNRNFKPLKLTIQAIDEQSPFFHDVNLDDSSIVPYLNLNVTAESSNDYLLDYNSETVYIPGFTKLVGYVSELIPPKRFNKHGFFKVTFNKVVCPNGEVINLKSNIVTNPSSRAYNPAYHLGKTTLSLIGGSLAGTLFSYQLGGLGLTLATHGYSLAAGAAAGGFIGTISGVTNAGKAATIKPGNELAIVPVNDKSIEELKQIMCSAVPLVGDSKIMEITKDLELQILSVKQKKDVLGDFSVRLEILFKNNSDKRFRLSNFFLEDSQGKEYTTTTVNFKDDIFIEFPPNEEKKAALEFFVNYPNVSHWLVLKDKSFQEEIGRWRVIR